MHELLFPAHIAFLTEGPHRVCLRHQAHNCTVLGFRHSAVDWSVVWGTTASCSQNSFLCHSVQGGSTDVLWPLKCLFSGVPVCWAPCEASLCGSGAHRGPPPGHSALKGQWDFQPVSVPSCLWVGEHLCSVHVGPSLSSGSIWHQGLDSSPGVIRLKVGWFNIWLMDTEGFASLKVPFYHSSHDRCESRTQLRAHSF